MNVAGSLCTLKFFRNALSKRLRVAFRGALNSQNWQVWKFALCIPRENQNVTAEVVNKSERMLLDDKMEKRKNLPDLERYTGALGHLLLCANSWSV